MASRSRAAERGIALDRVRPVFDHLIWSVLVRESEGVSSLQTARYGDPTLHATTLREPAEVRNGRGLHHVRGRPNVSTREGATVRIVAGLDDEREDDTVCPDGGFDDVGDDAVLPLPGTAIEPETHPRRPTACRATAIMLGRVTDENLYPPEKVAR